MVKIMMGYCVDPAKPTTIGQPARQHLNAGMPNDAAESDHGEEYENAQLIHRYEQHPQRQDQALHDGF